MTRNFNTKSDERRGNTIVLVTGILVLLVIIATAYITRTQAGRVTATSVNHAGQRDDNQNIVAAAIADELAQSLFNRNVAFPGPVAVDSNAPRIASTLDAVRYGSDPNAPYNVAPYNVVPYTEWPDANLLLPTDVGNWPKGPGNPGGGTGAGASFLAGETNRIGNPGFADCQWLRDLEPLRWDSWSVDPNNPNNCGPGADDVLDAFSHWRHLTNIARPDNAWRIMWDISDIDGITHSSLVTDLNIPVEQWLAMRPDRNRFGPTGDAFFDPNTFFTGWCEWFGGDQNCVMGDTTSLRLSNHAAVMANPSLVPLNFYRLSDLNADGFYDDWKINGVPQESSQSEFIPGTARWNVCRVLCDTDGDGYTDSFWFLAPTPVQNGIRQIVAMSIVDNSGMLNANVATRFARNNFDWGNAPLKTTGMSPVDLALLGQGASYTSVNNNAGNFNVGFFDNWQHWSDYYALGVVGLCWPGTQVQYTAPDAWGTRFIRSIGLFNLNGAGWNQYPDAALRMDYWRNAASHPLTASASSRYTPFTLGDEIELRMFSGNNYPWAKSRFEWNTEGTEGLTTYSVLRSSTSREESSEFLDQLRNREMLLDLRHRTTLFSAARNDQAPPWDWIYAPYMFGTDVNRDGVVWDAADRNLFQLGMRKFDLRIGPFIKQGTLLGRYYDTNGDGVFDDYGLWNVDLDHNTNPIEYNYRVGIAIRDHLERCLMDDLPSGFAAAPGTYFGNSATDAQKTRELSAAYAANIVQRRDADQIAPVAEAVPVSSDPAAPAPIQHSFLGMEPQPFIVEAFIGHVYKAYVIPPTDMDGNPYSDAGHYVLLDGGPGDHRTTVVVVQLANPFNVPIDLSQYRLTVFGQNYRLWDPAVVTPGNGQYLLPSTDEAPVTAIYYAISENWDTDSTAQTFGAKWRDFLDIVTGTPDQPAGTIIQNVGTAWATDRGRYDSSSAPAIVLSRNADVPDPVAPPTRWVDVDRIDSTTVREFGDKVNAMETTKPVDAPDPLNSPVADVPPGPYPVGVKLGAQAIGYKHWVQWVRATRAWGADLNRNGRYDPSEKSPRYVFANKAVVEASGTLVTDPETVGPTFTAGGDRYRFDKLPDGDPAAAVGTPDALQWFTRKYYNAQNVVIDNRKPTFFDMNKKNDPATLVGDPYFPTGYSYPDKGWYGQRGTMGVDTPVIDPASNANNVLLNFPMQMLQKDDDFEQVGELQNVWLYGHELDTPGGTFNGTTIKTFSEYLADDIATNNTRTAAGANRLRVKPVAVNGDNRSAIIGIGDPNNLADPRHAFPPLPAGARVFDAFVCDGPGLNTSSPNNLGEYRNAKSFDGTGTPGLININTAPPEVMQSIPDWYRLVHESGKRRFPTDWNQPNPSIDRGQILVNYDLDWNAAPVSPPLVTDGSDPTAMLPRTMIPYSVIQYRERFNGGSAVTVSQNPTGMPYGPSYENRGGTWQGTRGFASIGELPLLDKPAQYPAGYVDVPTTGFLDRIFKQFWQIDLGITPNFGNSLSSASNDAKPFCGIYDGTSPVQAFQAPMQISTIRVTDYDPFANQPVWPGNAPIKRPHTSAGDIEEANALFAGASNMITTRSDTFTVYFRIRSFRQNTSVSPPVWDATNPDYIVDDSRFVMLVDRSNVNHPGDKPKILYLEKLPN